MPSEVRPFDPTDIAGGRRTDTTTDVPRLRARDLQLGYWDRRRQDYFVACHELSLEIFDGEFIAVVGPSGCGKTTFLSATAGLLPIGKGALELNGRAISGPSPERALVFQQASLFPWSTVTGNVLFPLKAQHALNGETRRRAADLIRLVGLAGAEHKYPRELSGGMSQRVNLARALVTDPQLLLLDEPFAALDAQTREVMQQELTRIWQADTVNAGKTAIFITHDVGEAVYLADRVLVFSQAPAHVRESVEIPLPRPRRPEIKRSTEFLSLVDHIVEQLPVARKPSDSDDEG